MTANRVRDEVRESTAVSVSLVNVIEAKWVKPVHMVVQVIRFAARPGTAGRGRVDAGGAWGGRSPPLLG
eukprot:3818360-Prymnesium_polylepis.1